MNLIPRYSYDDIFDNLFDVSTLKNNIMKADIFEKNGSYIMEIEMPGFNKEDIYVDYNKGYLTISSKKENVQENKDYVKRERFYGEYQRSFYIGDVEEKSITAHFDNGILELTFPKEKDKNSGKKNIQIQ